MGWVGGGTCGNGRGVMEDTEAGGAGAGESTRGDVRETEASISGGCRIGSYRREA